MERSMLTVLGFDVSAPTSLKFLGYYMHMVRAVCLLTLMSPLSP